MEAIRELRTYSGYPGSKRAVTANVSSGPEKKAISQSGIRALAEGVILQAIEDLADNGQMKEGLQFFVGEGFDIWAAIARLNRVQQIQLARLVSGAPSKSGRGAGRRR